MFKALLSQFHWHKIFLESRVASTFSAMAATPNVAIVRHQEGDEFFMFSFFLSNKELNTERQFNMRRPLTEPSTQFIERLSSNVGKVVNKKNKKKRKAETDASAQEEPVYKAKFLDSDGSELPLLEDKEIKDLIFHSGVKFDLLGQQYSININPPMVEKLTLPPTMMVGFMLYPHKISLEFANQDLCKFTWFVSEFKEEGDKKVPDVNRLKWIQRHDGYYFTPSADDIGRYVKLECTPVNDAKEEGCTDQALSKITVSAGPGLCPFDSRHAFTRVLTNDDSIRVVTYNLLADLYADSDYSRTVLHPQCPPYALAIGYRKQLFIKEILGYNGDIICLQEVDKKIFEYDLQPVLKAHGYEGCYDKKGGEVSEGVACFWRESKFELEQSKRTVLSEDLVSISHFADLHKKLKGNEPLMENLLKRTTALQTTVLKSKTVPNFGLVVGTTHLFFKPDADHIRLLQSDMCIRELKQAVIKATEKNSGCKYGLLFCGDFNSTPPFGVLEFMRNGKIPETHADWSSCEGEEVKGLSLSHDFQLDSACGTPKYTNYTTGFADCLDYIFYDKESFSVTEVVPFPSEEELQLNTAIPNILFPSDHIACVAELKVKIAKAQ